MKVIVDNEIYVQNASAELYRWARQNLVVTNPKYETLMRINKQDQIARYHIEPKMALYVENGFDLILPFGCLYAIWPFIKNCEVIRQFNNANPINCPNDVITQPLYDYQEEAVQKMVVAKSGILIGGCGSGKTNCGIEIIHRIGKNALWLTHTKDLLRQTVLRIKSLYPNMHIGTITEGKVDMVQDGITVSTIQTLVNIPSRMWKDKFDIVMTDECFPKGTKILTKNGYKNIEDIKIGDYVLSYNHKENKTEYKKVSHLFVKTSSSLNIMRLHDNVLVGTKNHPIFTQRGYVPMEDLKNEDYVLQILWNRSNAEYGNEINLESCEKKGVHFLLPPTCNSLSIKTTMVERDERKNVFENERTEYESSSISSSKREDENQKSYERFGNKKENGGNQRKKWNPTSSNKKPWGKWANSSLPRNIEPRASEDGNGNNNGVCCAYTQNKRTKTNVSTLLQDRYSNTIANDSDRGRREFSSWRESQSERCEEKCFLVWQRVESIQSFKQTSEEECDGSCTVYNLEVEDNNNYFANDILVHNCHHVSGSPTLQKHFVKIITKIPARYKYGLTASDKRNDTLTKSMYATIGCNLNGEFEPVWRIAREEANTLTAEHIKVELDTPFNYCMLNDDGSFNYPALVDYIATYEPRNDAICEKVLEMAKEGRKQLVLSHRIEQCELLYKKLLDLGLKAVLLVGKVSSKKRDEILTQKVDWEVIVATVSLAKEGLDVVNLDTLHLASCISNKSDTVQSVGRIERVCEGKKEPIALDYVDINIPYLVSRYKKRVNWLKRR